ncbi:P-loop containing nucleoside triphosphate hydrolase protein [Mycena metata]|uniref:P-loop containing nucleoside triphosphate hydrolase protein n=1 Tax=Mycena metata TaxID=1033252 RepID=A0AAD7HIK4_9AGAR|nr:P-loop containing nucleoside triphosphate hydrolase protein [Mycena metata]
MNYVKCVMVGDDAVGKTALLTSYTTNNFPTKPEHLPYVFGGHAETVLVGENEYSFSVFDTACGPWPEYQHSRPTSYPKTDVFLVCFSVGSRASFENVKQKWLPEIHHFCPGVPWVLVGTQIDLRDEERDSAAVAQRKAKRGRLLTAAAGEKLTRELKAAKYVECSAKTHQGVKQTFREAIDAAVKYQSQPLVEDERKLKLRRFLDIRAQENYPRIGCSSGKEFPRSHKTRRRHASSCSGSQPLAQSRASATKALKFHRVLSATHLSLSPTPTTTSAPRCRRSLKSTRSLKLTSETLSPVSWPCSLVALPSSNRPGKRYPTLACLPPTASPRTKTLTSTSPRTKTLPSKQVPKSPTAPRPRSSLLYTTPTDQNSLARPSPLISRSSPPSPRYSSSPSSGPRSTHPPRLPARTVRTSAPQAACTTTAVSPSATSPMSSATTTTSRR